MGYPGGKSGAGVYQKLINLMPPHRVYIEPFLGGATVLRLKRPALINIGVDRSRAALELFGDRASLETTVEASIAKIGERRRPTSAPETILAMGDGIELLERFPFQGDELVYCDPPYLMETRSGKKLYEFELSSSEHRRLLRCVRKIPASVMISGYWSSMYAEALAGWNSISFEAMTRAGRTATEWLWYNFPEPVALHDYRFLGANFRERERIKRKKLRWSKRLAAMPRLERQALLCAIEETRSHIDDNGESTRSGNRESLAAMG
jgi:DNA adenine methylase